MKTGKNKHEATTSKIIALILFAMLIGMFAKFGQGGFLAITGAQVTAVGNTTVTLTGTISVNLDDSNAGLGSGYVNESFIRASVTTDANRTNWVNTTRFLVDYGDPMHLLNNGTAPANITIYAANTSNQFIGGSGPEQLYRAVNNESSSCSGSLNSTWSNLTITETNLCSSLDYLNTRDELNIYFNITIPSDAPAGSKSNAITFTARLATL